MDVGAGREGGRDRGKEGEREGGSDGGRHGGREHLHRARLMTLRCEANSQEEVKMSGD